MTKMTKAKKARLVDVPKLVEAASPSLIKLDLGCGLNPREDFEGVDLYGDKAKHKIDLFKFPWSLKDNSVDEISCSHLLEHIPAREVEERDLVGGVFGTDANSGKHYLGADMFFAFMDECWRIMKVGAWMNVVVPSGRSDRAFWDPTHRRFLMQTTFLYFAEGWRIINGLEHYRVSCNFGVDIGHTQPAEEGIRAAEVQADRLRTLWNVTVDWIAKMQKQERLTASQVAEFVAQRQKITATQQGPQQPPAVQPSCPACTALNESDAKFCKSCGAPMATAQAHKTVQ